MPYLILQYRPGNGPQVIDDFFSASPISALVPYVLDPTIFTSRVPSKLVPVLITSRSFGSAEEIVSLVPTIGSTSNETGGHEDPNAWWINSFGEAGCSGGSPSLLYLTQVPPTWYTAPQYTSRINTLGIGDPC